LAHLVSRVGQESPTTSPPLRVPRARHVSWGIELVMNRTEPSMNAELTPPEW
jgi:hypothetical protein